MWLGSEGFRIKREKDAMGWTITIEMGERDCTSFQEGPRTVLRGGASIDKELDLTSLP